MTGANDERAGRSAPSVPDGEPSVPDGESTDATGSTHPGTGQPRRRIDRRSLLRSVAGAGYALAVANVLGIDDYLAAEGGTVTVDVALVRPDPDDPTRVERRTRDVPSRWHAAVSAALELHAHLNRLTIPGYVNSAVVPGPYEAGTARISIGLREGDLRGLPDDLAELVPRIDVHWDGALDAVSVEVERVNALEHLESDAAERGPHVLWSPDVDRVPGGVRCETRSTYATLTPAIYHPERDAPGFATALHAFDDVASAVGAPIRVPTARRGRRPEVGYVAAEFPDADMVVANPAREFTPGSELARPTVAPSSVHGGDGDDASNGGGDASDDGGDASNDGGDDPLRIVGQFTLWGLADLVARGERLAKIGGTTGRTEGKIHGIDAATCVTADRCRRGQLRWGAETDMSDGDSGSVAYHPNPAVADGALVASINSARTWWPGQDHVWGIAAHALTEAHGYHF